MTKLTRKQAIDQNCYSCAYDPANGGTKRQQVTLCSCYECFLWQWRPVSHSDLPEAVLDTYGVADPLKSKFRGPNRDFYAAPEGQ